MWYRQNRRTRRLTIQAPFRELKGFQKILLQPGERKVLRFSLGPDELGFYNGDGEFLVEPGMFDIFVGGVSTADLSTSFSYKPR